MLCLLKLALLVLYLALIIFIAVLSDVVRMYNMNFVTSSAVNVVDVRSLATETLESILQQRGVPFLTVHNFYHFLQYQEFTAQQGNQSAQQNQHHRQRLLQLVELTGMVRVEEILDLDSMLLPEWNSDKFSSSVGSLIGVENPAARGKDSGTDHAGLWKTLNSGSDLLEEIEDRSKKDASWLILVRVRGGASLLDQSSWQEVIEAVSHFGIKTAVFDCARERWTCDRRNWVVPQLILTLPEKQATSMNKLLKHKKELVWHYSYNLHKSCQVVSWVARQLATQVHRLRPADLGAWKKFDSGLGHKLRIIFVSEAQQPPMFLSAIAVRFSSRIDVGIIDMAYASEISSLLGPIEPLMSRPPTTSYIVLTPLSGLAVYGERGGEALSFRRMEIFLNFMVPEARSVLTVTLTLVNLTLCIELFLISSPRFVKHVLGWVSRVLKYNAVLLLVWLCLIGLMQSRFRCIDAVVERGLTAAAQNFFNRSYIGCLLRSQWLFISCFRVLAVSVFIFGSLVGVLWWQVRPRSSSASPAPSAASSPSSRLARLSSRSGDVFATPLLAPTALPSPHHYHSPPHRQLSWIERGSHARSVVLLNQLFGQVVSLQRVSLAPPADSGEQVVIDVAGQVPTDFMHFSPNWLPIGVSFDYISQLPKWRFKFANVDEVLNLVRDAPSALAEGSEENEAVLLQYAKFPAGMLPSLICSICLERYHGERTDINHLGSNNNNVAGNNNNNNNSHNINNNHNHNNNNNNNNNSYANHKPSDEGTEKTAADTLCGLPCGHTFHAHCVLNWLTRDHHVCPICRWPSYLQKQSTANKNRDSWGEWDLGSPV